MRPTRVARLQQEETAMVRTTSSSDRLSDRAETSAALQDAARNRDLPDQRDRKTKNEDWNRRPECSKAAIGRASRVVLSARRPGREWRQARRAVSSVASPASPRAATWPCTGQGRPPGSGPARADCVDRRSGMRPGRTWPGRGRDRRLRGRPNRRCRLVRPPRTG